MKHGSFYIKDLISVKMLIYLIIFITCSSDDLPMKMTQILAGLVYLPEVEQSSYNQHRLGSFVENFATEEWN